MLVVTGGAGFIGSAIIWELNTRGVENILIVDHLGNSEKWKNLRGLKFYDYLEKDCFRELLGNNKLGSSITAIIHMGACSSTREKDASFLIDNNFQFSKEVASYATRNNIRFIYASSAATYGDGAKGYDDRESFSGLCPLNMYGYSKQLFDLWALKKGYLHQAVGLKFSNVFGPNEYHKDDMRSVPLKAFQQIQSGGAMHLFKSYKPDYKDGEQKRDFVYVKDVIKMALFFLEHKECNGIYNIGSGKAHTWNELAKALFCALDKSPLIEYIEMPEELRNKYQYFTQLKMEKLKEIGYTEKCFSLEEAIFDYVRNYLCKNAYLSN